MSVCSRCTGQGRRVPEYRGYLFRWEGVDDTLWIGENVNEMYGLDCLSWFAVQHLACAVFALGPNILSSLDVRD
jgi:hypothetical protein